MSAYGLKDYEVLTALNFFIYHMGMEQRQHLTLVEEHVAPYRQAYLEARAHVARQQHAGKHEQDRIDAVEWLEKWDLLGSEG